MKILTALFLFLAMPLAPAAAAEFPLCMYGIDGPADMAVIKAAGFNCFQTYAHDPEKLAALAKEAAALKMKMLAAPDQVIGSSYDAAAKTWPMLAWYLCDEPEVQRLKAAEMVRREQRVKAWDAGQRTAFVMGNGMAAYTYGAAADVLMVDWYPVTHLKLESVGYHVTLLKDAALKLDLQRPLKPVWAVLQAFDWRDDSTKPAIGRFPTFNEVRFMSYLSIARGAGGLFYFSFQNKGGPLTKWPERWAIYEKLAAEINTLMPALEGVKDVPPPPGLDGRLSAKVVAGGGRTFMILLNPSPAMVPLDISVLKNWRPLFEEKRGLAALLPGDKAKFMPPYRTLVLEKRRRFLFF